MQVLYFAWLKERVGLGSEEVKTEAPTARALAEELAGRGDGYAAAFADTTALRVAIDQELTTFDAPLAGAREVAFFPPMTGG